MGQLDSAVFETMCARFRAGGIRLTSKELVEYQKLEIARSKKSESAIKTIYFNVIDQKSRDNLPSKVGDEVNIKDLYLEQITPETIIWVRIVSYSSKTASVNFIVQDKNKEDILLELYNQVE